MSSDMEQKRMERQSRLEERWIKLEQLQAEKEIQFIATTVRAYESGERDYEEERNCKMDTVKLGHRTYNPGQSEVPRVRNLGHLLSRQPHRNRLSIKLRPQQAPYA